MRRQLFASFAIALALLPSTSNAAIFERSKPVRIGVSLGALRAGGAALTADTGPVISNNISLGAEIYGLRLLSIRGLIWEQPGAMSGFFGGPKLFLGFGDRLALEPAGEFGWSYRFQSKVDVGLSADLVLGEYLGGTLKISAGYLF